MRWCDIMIGNRAGGWPKRMATICEPFGEHIGCYADPVSITITDWVSEAAFGGCFLRADRLLRMDEVRLRLVLGANPNLHALLLLLSLGMREKGGWRQFGVRGGGDGLSTEEGFFRGFSFDLLFRLFIILKRTVYFPF